MYLWIQDLYGKLFVFDIQGIIGVACSRNFLFFLAIRTVAVLTFTILQYFENFLLFKYLFYLLLLSDFYIFLFLTFFIYFASF